MPAFTLAYVVELLAALSGALGVWFTLRKQTRGWIWGTLSSAIYVSVFFQSKLYAEAALQGCYVAMGISGWMRWKAEAAQAPPIQRLKGSRALYWLGIAALGIALCGWLLDRYSDTDVPFVDATLAVSGLIITRWMALRILENWPAWVVLDAFSVFWYAQRGLAFTAGLYGVFTLLGLKAWFGWNSEWKHNALP